MYLCTMDESFPKEVSALENFNLIDTRFLQMTLLKTN